MLESEGGEWMFVAAGSAVTTDVMIDVDPSCPRVVSCCVTVTGDAVVAVEVEEARLDLEVVVCSPFVLAGKVTGCVADMSAIEDGFGKEKKSVSAIEQQLNDPTTR